MDHTIEAYSFGRIVIDGVEYTDDVVILPSKVIKGWKRIKGHEVALFDLSLYLDPAPERLIIGTGESGMCKVLKEVETSCAFLDIELIVKPTTEAIIEYNSLDDKERTVAAIHVTC